MKLKKVDHEIYVNTGIGNITSVLAQNADYVRINFISGSHLLVPGQVDEIVARLEAVPATE